MCDGPSVTASYELFNKHLTCEVESPESRSPQFRVICACRKSSTCQTPKWSKSIAATATAGLSSLRLSFPRSKL